MNRRRGMTLLELLLAVLVLAMFMVGVLAVVSRLGSQGLVGVRPWARPQAAADAVDAWAGLLRAELACGRIESAGPDRLVLLTQASIVDPARPLADRPARVTYFIEPAPSGDGSWLIRRQQMLDSAEAPRRDLVCRGVRAFSVTGDENSPWRLEVSLAVPSETTLCRMLVAWPGGAK
jgi:prepilin-type N-terminal cleavage/methylation domain-containing protein